MKKFIFIFVVVIAIIAVGLYSGFIPGLSININDETINKDEGKFSGVGELIQPENRKGFICSYKDDGLSESISIIGKIELNDYIWTSSMGSCRYMIYGKMNPWDSWEPLSVPGQTSMYISNPNPGLFEPPGGIMTGGVTNLDSYDFRLLGHDYHAIRAELWCYINHNILDPLHGHEWRLMQRDEAHLYEGWGGLYLPTGDDGRPRSTFEIGETVNIRVKTTYGGEVVGEGKTWRVVMYYPSDKGGAEFKTQDYGDNVDTTFDFTITNEMWDPSSTNEYRIEIFNTLVPRGYVPVYTIDILSSAPSDVSFTAPTQAEVGDTVEVTMSASTSSSDIDIDHFRYDVIYGTSDVLLPSDPLSPKWIIPPIDADASSNQATIRFTPEKESYVTIHSVAYDENNRQSAHIKTWTLWAYGDSGEVPDEVIEEEAGDNDYGGGHTDTWYPWDPSGGNWEEINELKINWIGVLISFLIFLGFILIGFIVFKEPKIIMIMAIGGLIVAILVYAFFFTNIFG